MFCENLEAVCVAVEATDFSSQACGFEVFYKYSNYVLKYVYGEFSKSIKEDPSVEVKNKNHQIWIHGNKHEL